MMEPVRPVHRHNVQRPSIMEIYHRISEEEAKARAKEEDDRDRYAKRWSSGYKLRTPRYRRSETNLFMRVTLHPQLVQVHGLA